MEGTRFGRKKINCGEEKWVGRMKLQNWSGSKQT
jgi:hypothetical protein